MNLTYGLWLKVSSLDSELNKSLDLDLFITTYSFDKSQSRWLLILQRPRSPRYWGNTRYRFCHNQMTCMETRSLSRMHLHIDQQSPLTRLCHRCLTDACPVSPRNVSKDWWLGITTNVNDMKMMSTYKLSRVTLLDMLNQLNVLSV